MKDAIRHGIHLKVAITLAERANTQPEAIVAWFYVGETEGPEFLHPKLEEQELAHATRKTFESGDQVLGLQ